jgi:sugar phosphate isomerase/epimerase
MKTPAISYQLYSSRNFPTLARQGEMLAGLGMKHVEPYGGLFTDLPALQGVLDTNGLTAPTAHIGASTWREDFDGTVAKLKVLGVGTAIMPAVPPDERTQDREGWQALGRELTGYVKRAADHGLTFAWHNHHFEFARLPDGSFPLEWILGDDPALTWQCDIAWVIRGGQDPADWIRRYSPRIVSFHVKDLAPERQNTDEDGWADVGHGVIDWAELLPAMRAAPASVWTLEHDNPNDDARFARNSFATVTGW